MSVQSSRVAVSKSELLRFFDEKPRESHKHATAIVAVAGEELGTGLLVHYLRKTGIQASVRSDPCTQGTRKGSRLDAWVDAGAVRYQVEVKNWSAHAIGAEPLRIDAPPEEVAEYRRDRWKHVWDGRGFKDPSVRKVLSCMRPPDEQARVEPAIVFWWPVHPDGAAEPFFRVPVSEVVFPVVNVFSMSNYLRQCSDDRLWLEMPNTCRRLGWLSTLFQVDQGPPGEL